MSFENVEVRPEAGQRSRSRDLLIPEQAAKRLWFLIPRTGCSFDRVLKLMQSLRSRFPLAKGGATTGRRST